MKALSPCRVTSENACRSKRGGRIVCSWLRQPGKLQKLSGAVAGCSIVQKSRSQESWATHWALLQSWLLVQSFGFGWRAWSFPTRISVYDVTYSCRIWAFTSVGCKGHQISLVRDIAGQFYLECCHWDQRHCCRAQAKMKMWESVFRVVRIASGQLTSIEPSVCAEFTNPRVSSVCHRSDRAWEMAPKTECETRVLTGKICKESGKQGQSWNEPHVYAVATETTVDLTCLPLNSREFNLPIPPLCTSNSCWTQAV